MDTESQVYTMYYDDQLQAVIMAWDGYATSSQFREGTEYMLEMLIQHKAQKVLGDIQKMLMLGMEDQKWLEYNFLPRAIQHGFRFIAFLWPENYFNKVAVESVSHLVDKDKLDIRFFDERKKAEEWLMLMT